MILQTVFIVQESLGPFPWPRYGPNTSSGTLKPHALCGSDGSVGSDDSETSTAHDLKKEHITEFTDLSPKTPSSSSSSILSSPSDISSEKKSHSSIDNFEFLEFKLPPVGVSAGAVLQHAKRVLSALFKKHDPMTFKIGYTHNALWRWTNSIYGYKHARERWTNMIILYESTEPFGPAMLEAALIDFFRSSLFQPYIFSMKHGVHLFVWR